MKQKLLTFSSIICMDGTHGTNRKRMDLTIILIKDDRNAGFPVAFLLSNRVDQLIQEVFLDFILFHKKYHSDYNASVWQNCSNWPKNEIGNTSSKKIEDLIYRRML
ncbi:hypothetical protein RN001_007812 [Aquatica leii]|uniref:MULE transposase domain-containing protein n=1 Tax=Aquatica leii TaxID=1421715 RepID=A0AAN7PDN7_9COLE|nr:hypothetical protein RN001_007812 [Aquatica leii]